MSKTRLAPLLIRNDAFARDRSPQPLAPPTAQTVVITCLDHRVDPASFLGLRLGDAPVIRNAGGRVTPAVIDDLAYLAFLARRVFQVSGPLFEVAIIHHTQCGTGFLADPDFRHEAATATGLSEEALAASEVADPYVTIRADVELLRSSPLIPAEVSISGHVYDVETGRVRTAIDVP